MQSFTEPKCCLGCADCKSSFTSASSLLQHFAQHISQDNCKDQAENECSHQTTTHTVQKQELSRQQKGKKKESILETVLKRSAMRRLQSQQQPNPSGSSTLSVRTFCSNGSSSSSSSSVSHSSEYSQDSNSELIDNKNILEEYPVPEHTIVLEIGQRAREKSKSQISDPNNITLLKFDLQKRLENCVLKLVSKRDIAEQAGKSSICQFHAQESLGKGKHLSKETKSSIKVPCDGDDQEGSKLSGSGTLIETSRINGDADDFNPLKFCVVTLEESEDKLQLDVPKKQIDTKHNDCLLKSYKGASNRKQHMPKKIPQIDASSLSTIKHLDSSLPLSLEDSNGVEKISSTKRKYPCHLCSKVFGWSTDLKRHILTHTGERPFKCQICNATFTRNFLLQKHENRVHNLGFTHSKIPVIQEKVITLHADRGGGGWNGAKHKVDHATKHFDITSYSDDSNEEKLSICEDEKKNETTENYLLAYKRKKIKESWHKKCPPKKRKPLQCNGISSYEIFSHEALNIL